MKLLTEEIKRKIPSIGSQQNDEAKVYAKFFCPWSNWTWYATEASAVVDIGDGDVKEVSLREMKDKEVLDVTFFGLVVGMETELGYFSLSELESVVGPGGLKIERDMYFGQPTLREVRATL